MTVLRGPHARAAFPHHHPRPQHGRRPRPVARDRPDQRRLRQADRRDRQLLHPVRARPRAPEGHGRRWSRVRSRGRRGGAGSSTPSPSTTASRWATTGCSTRLPSRELIADSVEYMVNAHQADALVCISNCDKITPGMLLAALRLNIPTVFVSGGAMEAGRVVVGEDGVQSRLDLIDAMVKARRPTSVTDAEITTIEENACPTCGSCSGMFTANSMNCLLEAVGLALPGNGSTLATPAARATCSCDAGRTVVELAKRWYDNDDDVRAAALDRHPRGARQRDARWTSRWAARPTRSCTCSPPPRRARSTSPGRHRRRSPGYAVPVQGRAELAPVPHGGRAPGRRHPRHHGRARPRPGCWTRPCTPCTLPTLRRLARRLGHARRAPAGERAQELFHAAPGGVRTTQAFSTTNRWESLDTDAEGGCIRSVEHAYTADGGLAVLTGNLAAGRLHRQDRGRARSTSGPSPARPRSPSPRRRPSRRSSAEAIVEGDVVVVRYEGPKGGPGHAGDALPDRRTSRASASGQVRADHRRPVLRRVERAVASGTSRPRRRPAG